MGVSSIIRLAQIIADIQQAPDRKTLEKKLLEGVRGFGFENYNLSVNVKDKHDLITPTLTSMPTRILEEFHDLGFVEIDPVLEHSITSRHAFSWTSRREHRDEKEKKLLEYLHAIPAVRGVVMPLPHVPGRVSTANVLSSVEVHYEEKTLHCLSIILHVGVIQAEALGLFVGNAQAHLLDADLSIRQIEILSWAAQGKSNGDIAVIIGMSKRSVDYHMSEILRKLKVGTRTQAISLARGRRSPDGR